jgi:hypothetical protein
MANLDWSECPLVESISGKRSGKASTEIREHLFLRCSRTYRSTYAKQKVMRRTDLTVPLRGSRERVSFS